MADFNFQREVEHLPFKLNLGDVHLDKEHQARFINLIYSKQEVFSLHDEDLAYCDKLTHTIPTNTNKPYTSHTGQCLCSSRERCTNVLTPAFAKGSFNHLTALTPPKLCVIVQKKSGEICLCVDYRKLNSITIWDAFPLPCIDEALQVVHDCNVFTSFNLVQRYLQLAMAEDDIQKTTFRASSSGLYEFTCLPFSLSNAGSSFCRLMEQCLGDQQFVTWLLYLDDICIFAPDVSAMMRTCVDWIELVFSQLKSFNLKIKPKKC